MIITKTVEYQNKSGEWIGFDVVFEGEPYTDNDSFDYAGTHCTHGRGGTQRSADYTTMQGCGIGWDKELYGDEINKIIEGYVSENKDSLDEEFCSQYDNE